MKNVLKILIILILISIFPNSIKADNEIVDLSNYTFTVLTTPSDQDENIIVSKIFNITTGQVAFCLEPFQQFNPKKYKYHQNKYFDEDILNICNAFYQFTYSDDLYIATQLLIWEKITGIEYTFKGKGHLDYGSNQISEKINYSYDVIDGYNAYLDKVNIIEGINFNNYFIESDDIEIIEQNENILKYKIINKNLDTFQIKLIYIKDCIIYNSLSSQDIFTYLGNKEDLKNLLLKININKGKLSIKYSKLDENNNSIKDAKFELYEINDEYDDYLYFINTDYYFNIKEFLANEIDDYSDEYSYSLSERYQKYLKNDVLNTNEIGYFNIYVYVKDAFLNTYKIYVSNDINITNNSFNKIKGKLISKSTSNNDNNNIIDGLNYNTKYFLVESEPAKGYVYKDIIGYLIDTTSYNKDIIYSFINSSRTFTLKLMKNDPNHNILLNDAKFKVNYNDGNNNIEKTYITGLIKIDQINNNTYLHIKYKDDNPLTYVFNDKTIELKDIKEGEYNYYQSNNKEIDNKRFKENSFKYLKGGFIIDDIPYNSKIIIQEIEAPKGYYIDNQQIELNCDIPYSELTFKNYRPNTFIIIPEKFKLPKTCIEN